MRRIGTPFLALGLLVMIGTVFRALPASASSVPLVGTLENAAYHNLCITIPGGNDRPGEAAVLAPCMQTKIASEVAGQDWNMVTSDDRSFIIYRNTDAGRLCLADPNDSPTKNTPIIQWPCDTANDQYWYYDLNHKTTVWEFTNRSSRLDMAASGGAQADQAGDPIIQWPWNTNVNPNQLWKLNPNGPD